MTDQQDEDLELLMLAEAALAKPAQAKALGTATQRALSAEVAALKRANQEALSNRRARRAEKKRAREESARARSQKAARKAKTRRQRETEQAELEQQRQEERRQREELRQLRLEEDLQQDEDAEEDEGGEASPARETATKHWARIHAINEEDKAAALTLGEKRYRERFGMSVEERKLQALEDSRLRGQVRQTPTEIVIKQALTIAMREADTKKAAAGWRRAGKVTDIVVTRYMAEGIRESGVTAGSVDQEPVKNVVRAALTSATKAGADPVAVLKAAVLEARRTGEPYLPWEDGIRRSFSKPKRKRLMVVDAEWEPVPIVEEPDGTIRPLKGGPFGVKSRTGGTIHGPELKVRLFSAYDGESFRDHLTVEQFIEKEFVPENSGAMMLALGGGRADFPLVLDNAKATIESRNKNKRRMQWQVNILRQGSRNFCLVVREGRYVTRLYCERCSKGFDAPKRKQEIKAKKFPCKKCGDLVRVAGGRERFRTKHRWVLVDFLVFVQRSLAEIGKRMKLTKGGDAVVGEWLRQRWSVSLENLRRQYGERVAARLGVKNLDGVSLPELFDNLTIQELHDFRGKTLDSPERLRRLYGKEAFADLTDKHRADFLQNAFEVLDDEQRADFYGNAPIDVLIAYNRDDLRILYAAADSFESTVLSLGGELKLTGSSTSMHIGRRMYLREDVETSPEVNRRVEDAYTGGRVERFRAQLALGWCQDFNSSYPKAFHRDMPGEHRPDGNSREMPPLVDELRCDHLNAEGTKCRASFPLKLGETAATATCPECSSSGPFQKIGIQFATPVLADVTVTVPPMHVPPIPFKIPDDRDEQHIYFPTGTWRCWLAGPDLEALIEAGGTYKLHEALHFQPLADFREYMDDVFKLRREALGREGWCSSCRRYADDDRADAAKCPDCKTELGTNQAAADWLKLLANGFYGKFGEGEYREEEIVGLPDGEALEWSQQLNDKVRNGRVVGVSGNKDDEIAIGEGRARSAPNRRDRERNRGRGRGETLSLSRISKDHWRKQAIVAVPHRHIPTASYTTGDARKRLWRKMRDADQLAYGDTDSVHSATRFLDYEGDALGELKTEYRIGFKWCASCGKSVSTENERAFLTATACKACGGELQGGGGVYAGEKCYRAWATKVSAPSQGARTEPTGKSEYNDKRTGSPVPVLKFKGVGRINRQQWDALVRGSTLPEAFPYSQTEWESLRRRHAARGQALPEERPGRAQQWKLVRERFHEEQVRMFGRVEVELPDVPPSTAEFSEIVRRHSVVQTRPASISEKARSKTEYHHELIYRKRMYERELPKREMLANGETRPWSTDEIWAHFAGRALGRDTERAA